MNNERNKMPTTTMTTIKLNRKASKPMMEKRRRARINQSLSELKDLVVCSSKYEINNCRRSKLEKADILEMTVRHLHHLHNTAKSENDQLPVETKVDNLAKFRAGFHECVNEVNRYLNEKQLNLDGKCRNGLTIHLNTKLNHLHRNQNDTIRPNDINKHRDTPKDNSNSSIDQCKQQSFQHGYQCDTDGLSSLNSQGISPVNDCVQVQLENNMHRNPKFKPEIEMPQIAVQHPEIELSVWRPW